jgi:hypothetical protein
MNEAAAAAVADFQNRERIQDRKEELLKNPLVVEALVLFGPPHPTKHRAERSH